MRISDKHLLVCLLFLWITFVAVRLLDLESMPVYLDEGIRGYIMWSSAGGDFTPVSEYYFGTPLELLVVPLFAAFGPSILLGRVSVIVVSSLMIPLLYFLRNEMTNQGTVLAAVLLALFPAFIVYQRVWKGDQLILMFFMLFLVCVYGYKRTHGRKHILGAGVALGLCYLSKPTALILTAIVFSYLLALLLLEVVKCKSITVAFTNALKVAKPFDALLFVLGTGITATLGWLLAVWLSSPGLSAAQVVPLAIEKVWGLYFGELNRGVTAGERDFFYFLGFMTPLWYLWFLVLGICSVFFVLLGLRKIEFNGNSQFYIFTICWTILAFVIHSAMTYAYPRHSLYFLIPLALTCGILGEMIASFAKVMKNALSKVNQGRYSSAFSTRAKANIPIFLIGFLIINTGVLAVSSIPGISTGFHRDVRKDAAERALQVLDDRHGISLVQIDKSASPWKWHFRSILNTDRYAFFYVDVFNNDSLSMWLLSEKSTAFYLLSIDVISQEIVAEIMSNYGAGLNSSQEVVIEWFNPTEGYTGEQLLIYYI